MPEPRQNGHRENSQVRERIFGLHPARFLGEEAQTSGRGWLPQHVPQLRVQGRAVH